jgi:hypothetical protein
MSHEPKMRWSGYEKARRGISSVAAGICCAVLLILVLVGMVRIGEECVSYGRSFALGVKRCEGHPLVITGTIAEIQSRRGWTFSEKYAPSERFLPDSLVLVDIRDVRLKDGTRLVFKENPYTANLRVGGQYTLRYFCTGLHSIDTGSTIYAVTETR